MLTLQPDNTLRPYQATYKQKIYELWTRKNSVMLQMPTGTGKTRLFTSIVKDIHKYSEEAKTAYRVLILAHRNELIEQISYSIGQKYLVAHGLIVANRDIDLTYPTQVASIQTLTNRLKKNHRFNFDVIIIDEAHHSLADSYTAIIDRFPGAKILGVTATPYRMNGAGFTKIFQDLITSPQIQDFINEKWLSPYAYYSIKPNSEIQKMIDNISEFEIDGDYSEKYLSEKFDTLKIRSKIIDNYKKYAPGKKGIVYTINKLHNERVCEEFRKIGVKADFIDSSTSSAKRQEKVKLFRNGEIEVLCNVNIFTEGFDCPDVEFIQLARPTKSLSLYLQQVGRGLRPHPLKSKVVFIDNVGLYNKFGLPSSKRNWRHYFEGKTVGYVLTNEKSDLIVGYGGTQKVDEGDEDLMEVYSNDLSTDYEIPIIEVEYFFTLKKTRLEDELFTSLAKEMNIDVNISDEEFPIHFEFYDEDEYSSFEPPQYMLVEKSNLFGIWDTVTQKFVVEPLYTRINKVDYLNRFIVENGIYKGLIDANTWQFIIKCEYEEIKTNWYNFYIVEKNNQFGLFKNRELFLEIKYDEIWHFSKIIFVISESSIELYNINLEPIDITKEQVHHLVDNLYFYNYDDIRILTDVNGSVLIAWEFSDLRLYNTGIETLIVSRTKFAHKNLYILLDLTPEFISNEFFNRLIPLDQDTFIANDSIVNSEGVVIASQIFNKQKIRKIENYSILDTATSEFYVVDKQEEVFYQKCSDLKAAKHYISQLTGKKKEPKSKVTLPKTIKAKDGLELSDHIIEKEKQIEVIRSKQIINEPKRVRKRVMPKPHNFVEDYLGYEIIKKDTFYSASKKNVSKTFNDDNLVKLKRQIQKFVQGY